MLCISGFSPSFFKFYILVCLIYQRKRKIISTVAARKQLSQVSLSSSHITCHSIAFGFIRLTYSTFLLHQLEFGLKKHRSFMIMLDQSLNAKKAVVLCNFIQPLDYKRWHTTLESSWTTETDHRSKCRCCNASGALVYFVTVNVNNCKALLPPVRMGAL